MAKNQIVDSASYEAILKQAAGRKKVVFSFSKTYPAYLVLIVFLVLSYFVWDFFKNKVQEDNQVAFDKAVGSVMNRLDNKFQSNVQILNSLTGIYDQEIRVVKDKFRLFGSVPTRNYPSVISMMYVMNVKDGEAKEDFIFQAQRQDMPDYKIWPEAKRDVYYPIYFIEDYNTNMFLAGYDLATDEQNKLAIEKARDNNALSCTRVFRVREEKDVDVRLGKVIRDSMKNDWGEMEYWDRVEYENKTLHQDQKDGFYLMAPVYFKDMPRETVEERRKNFNGVVLIEIDVLEYFKQAIGEAQPSDTSIVFSVFDDAGESVNEVYKSANYDKQYDDNAILTVTQAYKFADREFQVTFSTVKNFGDPLQAMMPTLSLIISLVLSFAFFGFVLSVSTSRARAVDLADRMTRSQRRIVDSSEDIIAVMSLDGVWKSMNPASIKIFGIAPDTLIGQKINGLFLEEEENDKFNKLIASGKDEFTERSDFRMKNNSGDLKWLSWSFTISNADNLVYCIGRDVTLEKLAEEEARLRSKQIELAEQINKESSEFKSYFMNKLSHQMRNSLTGILGYTQLLINEIYDDNEERDSYLKLAEESAEELFTFVSDLTDIANETKLDISTLQLDKVFESVSIKLNKILDDGKTIKLSKMGEGEPATTVGDNELLNKTFLQVFKALSEGIDKSEIQIAATENKYEGATEIQIMTNANALVSEMIEIFKNNKNNLIEALTKDKEDILLQFAIAESNFRLMNGHMSLETFGADEGNVVQITMPLNKAIDQ